MSENTTGGARSWRVLGRTSARHNHGANELAVLPGRAVHKNACSSLTVVRARVARAATFRGFAVILVATLMRNEQRRAYVVDVLLSPGRRPWDPSTG
jgi:hypothetical protein